MANEQNLIPNSQRTPEELREMTRKGGIASGIARMRKKHGKELARMILDLGISDPAVRKAMQAQGYDPDEVSGEFAMHVRQIEKAQKTGNTEAYKAVLKVAGYIDKEEGTGSGITLVVNASPDGKANIEKILQGKK